VLQSSLSHNPSEIILICRFDERDRVQKKTFTKWVNKHLIKVRKHITDLYEDLRDGHNLISLLEVLSGVTLPREKGRMRFHRLQNVQIALDFLKQRQVKLVNIRNDDITDGNPKLTLGLIWTIILHFQISEIYVSGESGDLTAKEKLLIWSKQATEGYPGLRCANFSSSWSNGHLFNALLHRYRPDLIDMEVVAQQSNRENLEQAFEIAESLGVTRLLDAEDVDVPSPDEKSVITYVSSIYDAFPKIPEGGEGIAAHEVDQRWTEYQSGFSSLLQWTRQHTALMANRSFPHNPVELKALYNEYVHFKETEIPAKEREKSHIEHLYKLLEAWIEFGRIKLPQGLHPNDLEEEWGKLILEMLEREKALRPAVERLELLLQKANKIQNMAVDCEEKLTLAKNTLQADMSQLENGQPVRCENELGMYLQDCEALIRQLHLDLQVLRDEKYYQVEQLAFRVSCLQEELVSLRLHCASVYRKGHFSTGGLLGEHAIQKGSSGGLATLGAQTLLGAVGAAASLLRRPMSRADLVAMSSSEDEGSLRFIYELLGWVEETQDLLLRAEWGSDLPSVEQHLQDHHIIHKAVEDLLNSLKEARNYESRVSPNLRSSYSETLSKLENQYCKLLEHSSWRLRCLESLRTFVSHCTEELIWLNEREEEELAFDWSDSNTNMAAKRESELEVKQEVMRSLQETADHLCQENHPAKQTVEAYSAALQTQWQWIKELCICVEQHLKDNTAYFQFTSDARDCESYLRQLQDTIKRQYTCDKNSRLGRLEDLLQDSMEEKEQLIEYRSTVASLVGRAKSVVQLRPRSADSNLGTTTPIRAICDYRQIEITISKGEECVLEDNSQRTKWKVISSTGNEAMVPSVCFTIPPPNQEAIDTASRMEQMYQNVMSLWHQLHVNMKSVVSWHYLHKDIRNIASWSLDTMRLQAPAERQQALDNLEAHLSDFLTDSRESSLFTPTERRELEREAENCREHCQTLLVSLETVEKDELASRAYLSELQSIKSHLEDAESRLMRGMQTPHPSTISGDVADNAVHIAEQEKLQQDLKGLQSDLGEVSRRCVSFFEEKPSSSSVPVLRSELNLAVEHIEKLNSLSSVYLQKLKTVDVLMRSLQAAESQVKKYESRLSEEDIVPADTAAIQALGEQLNKWHSELEEQNNIFESLSLEVQQAREVGNQLNQLHPDRSPELDRYQEKAQQLTERWSGVRRQLETRQADLEMLGSVLQQYREGHSSLIRWIEETTEKQENTQPEQTDSRALSEQLAQQTALVAEIEQNQVKLDECQTHSKQYCAAVKDYELQLMTFRAFVESTQKSPVKRRRMHSSSDVITQEFMDLRTRYTALVTLTTQHVKYINDALRRLEEEEVCYAFLSLLLEVFTYCKHAQVFRAQVVSQLDELTATYTQLCDSSAEQLQQLEEQQGQEIIAGVIDLGTMETFPIFQAAQHGLIDQDTCHVLLEAQVVMGGLFQPDSPDKLSLDKSLSSGLIDKHTYQSLEELEHALGLVNTVKFAEGQDLPVAIAMKEGVIKELVGLRILELQISTGSLKSGSSGEMVSLDNAREKGLLSPDLCQKLQSCLHRRELIDPNTAEKLSLVDFQQRCVVNQETGLRFFPVKQKPGGTVCLCSGRKVGIFCAVQEGLIDRHVTVRLLEAQLFAGGITDPRSGHRLTVNEAVRHGLMDQDLACTLMTRQLETGGIIDPVSGERLELDEAIKRDLLSPRIALRVLESLQSFMAIMWPESGELLPVSEALQQGVVNRELAAKALRKRHSVGAVYLPESGQVVPLHQAEKILKPQAVEILKHIQVQDVLPHVSPSSSLYMKRLSSGSAYSSSPPEGRSDEQVQNHLLSQVMTHSYINAHSGERLVLLEPELVELICRDIKTANLARPVQLQISDNVRVMLDSKAMSGTEEEKNEELKISQHEIACRDSYMEETVEMAGEDLVWQEKILSGECDEPEIKKDEIDWKNTEIGETKVKAEEDLPLLAVSERTFMEPSQEDYWQKDVVSLGQYEEPKIDISKIASKKTDMGETIERTEEYLAPSTGKGLNLTVPFQTSSTLPKTKSDNGAPSQNQIIDSTLNESENKQTLDLEQADNSGENKRIFEQPGKDKKLYPLEIKTLSVELSDDDVKLESMALELQQRGLVTVGGQKVLLDEAVAQGLLPGHTAIKLMEEAGLFGGFLDINACKSLSVEDVMQEGLLDEDLMACVLHSEKILAGVIDVEHGRHCSIRDAAEAGLLDSDTAARLLEAQVVSGGIVDLRRDKKLSVTLAANFGLIEEGRKEKLLALEKSCRGKCSDPNAVQTKLALQLQMKGVVDPKTKNAVPLEQALQTGLIGQNEAQTILCQQVAEGGIVHPGSGVRLAVVDALQLGLIDHTVAPKLMELEKEFKGQEPRSLDQNTSLLQASTGSIYDDASKSRITLSEAVSKGLLAAETANKAMDSSNVKSGLLDPHKACIVSYSELINQGKIDIEKRQRFLEVRPFRGVPHKQTDEMMTLPQAIKTGQIDPIPAVRVLQSQADTGGIINIYTGERLPLPEAINKGLVDKDMAKCIATNQLLKGGLLNPASGQKVSSITEAIEYGLISTEMAAELQHSMGLVDEHEKKSSKISASSMKATSSSFVPEMISEHVSPNKMSLEKGLLTLLDHTTEMEIKRHTVNVSAFTTAILSESSDNSKEQVPSTEQTTGETEIQRQTVSEPAISEVSFSDTDDGLQNKEQTPSIEQIEGHSFKLEKDQYKPEKIKDSQETGLDPYASTTTRPVKVSGKKKGRGKNGKQAKMESDVKLQVSETSARISPIEKAEVDGQDGFTTNQKRIMKDDKEKLVAVQQSETTHGSGSTAPLTGSDETVQGRDLEIGDDRTDNETKTPKCDTDHETNEKQKEKTQKSVTTYMAKTDQSQEAVVVSKDLGTEVSEKKRKKKSKSKKVKQVCIVETEGVEKIDDETEKEHKMVIHEVQPQSNQSDEKESMKQLEKASQAMAQKEILLMKAKESILRKVFERGVSEKQAAEELEAMRQVASIGEYRITTQEETVVEKTSTKPPQSKKKDNKLHQTGQEINERVERSVPNIAENPLPGSDIDPCSSAKAQLQKPEEDQHDKHTNTGLKCLEHDQQIVALLSMVRHIEVRLKQQQQQQSIGRSLSTLDDIIKQTEMLFLEISDLEPEVHKKTEAATQLLESSPQDVPPQLLIALEKDGRSLARAYSAARDLAQNTLQGLREQYINSDGILYSFYSTHIYISSYSDGIFFTLILFFPLQMLQNSLSARSSEVSNVAFNIQVFISEHAQDLLPDQSRHLLGQLEQLQRVFHQAVGLNHARAEALSAHDQLTETIRSVEEFLSDRGDSLSPEERAKLQGTLSQMKEQHSSLTNSVLSKEQMQETQEKIDTLLRELSSLDDSKRRSLGYTVTDTPSSGPPENLQQLQAQQAHLQQVAQSVHSLLEQPDSSVPPEEKQRLRAKLEQLQSQHQERLQNCQDRLRRTDALRDEFAKFVQEHGNLGTWLDQSEQELRILGEGETDNVFLCIIQLAEDVICHKADLRFVTISGQKVLDSIQGALEKVGSTDPALEETRHLVSGKLQDATQRYSSLHSKVGTKQLCILSILTILQVISFSISADNLVERVSFCRFIPPCKYGHALSLKTFLDVFETSAHQDCIYGDVELVLVISDTLEKRFETLSNSVSVRAEQLQTAVAQSVSVQEGLKALLAWLDGLPLSPGELLSRQGSVDATLDSVSKLLKSADASTASGLQGALQDLSQRYTAAQAKQTTRETELRGLLPKLESFERQSADLRSFTQSRERALSPVGQPDCSVDDYKQTIEVRELEITQESIHKLFYFTWSKLPHWSQHCVTINKIESFFVDIHLTFSCVLHSFDSIQSCVQQLADFRSRSGSLLRWLQTVQEQLPAKEPNLSTESLQRRAQQLKDLLTEWETQGSQVQELNKTSSQLENLIINITSPKNKTDLTEIQVAVADVNCKYEQLGSDMRERKGKQEASLDLRQKARQSTEALIQWLSPREQSLAQGQTASPSRPEAVRAQAQETKVLLTELANHSGKVEDLKNLLNQLITDNPDSPDAETWKRQLEDIDSRWTKANQTAAHRQTELEACADRLGSFAAAASQLGPWLREKELMMSVLGPLSIDPNMLNTQKQQVQFMLREFETRQPQFDQLSRAAEGILSPSGDEGSRDGQDLEEVRQELADISQQWEGLTSRLTGRSQQIDQAQGTSERYLALLRELSQSVTDLSERLDAQASLSAQPDALRRRLQETGEIRAELEQRRGQLAQAEQLCAELSTIVAELYLRDELHKRLESVSGPLKNLEERAADGLSQLQAALSSTQQFQQMFDELRSWLDGQAGNHTAGASEALPCQPDALKSLLAQQEDLQRAIAQQRGSYELIQAEGTSLLASLPAGDERLALQTRLNTIRQDWEGMNQQTSNKHSRIKETLSRAELYQHHHNELVPWVAECEEREAEIHPSLDPATLDEALQKARQLSLDLDRRRPLLESLNTAADQLLEQSCTGEEEVRDEKAQLNRRIDGLSERLQGRTAQLEELGSRLKEFEDGRLAVERRLEAAKHQIEVQEALGPQACSNKSLERLRSQQELLNSVQPQVVYLRNLAQGLLQDAPEISRAGEDGGQRLLQQARDTEKEFEEVTEKVRESQCCSSLESRLQGVGEVQSRVRDVFSRLADLDDELDSLSPVGRDADSLASQADAVRGFLSRLDALRAELESHGGECTTMLRREGSSPDLLALRRETEALSRQAGKLAERGQNRLALIEAAEERVKEFYGRLADLQGLLGRAEEALNTQAVVGTEVEVIKQQLQEFKVGKEEQIDSIQPKLQHVNAVGQGLIQSAAKHTDTQALEHDLETTNLCWNSLNKRVAERIAQLQEALLHCGKFQDALEPLLSWLSDTEELIANQKPPSVEYRVVKAQIQEQKLLQRLLDDRRGTVEMIRAEGERIAATAETQDRDKIQKQLKSLGERWTNLLEKASARQQQLEELQVLALQFHEAVEPLGEWLSATERRLSSAEPMGTQTSKITQQIVRHKALQEEVSSRENGVNHLETLSQSLHPLSCAADRDWLGERVAAVRNGHTELRDWCSRREVMLEQALANAQLFGEEEVEVLNWLAEVAQRLAEVSVQSYQPELLEQQHKHTLALNEEIISRKKTVDQAIKNGQALLKQTTGEEVLLIQEKLDGIKSRYAEMTAGSSKALRTLEQALQLATRFASSHDDISQWLDSVEAELNNIESDTTPAYQDRQRELKCVSAEKRLVLDTVNEVGSALLDLVPWRAREGLDRLVADANQRYRQAEETITQRVQLVQAAIQRSQQYEEAVDAELAWVGETERKLASLGPLSLEPDVTVAQLQVQRAFNIDIIRHKDTVDQLLKTQEDILESCSEQQREALKVKTDSLSARYEAVNQSHAERFSALEQAQVLVARFWETYEELEPWLGETETLITQLPPPAIDTEALRQQQDQMRLLRESIAEHKPHIDKMLKIGPQLAELSAQEGARVRQRYNEAERRYLGIKEEVKGRATALDEAVSQSVQFHDKMDPLLETLEGAVQRLRQPPPVAAEVEKIREQLAEHRATGLELDKLLPSFSALCARGEELISRAPHDDPAAQAVHSRLLRLRSLWDEIRQRAEEREGKLQDVLDLAGKFWADMAALLSTLRDSQDIVKDLEDPGVDPSLIKQQIEAAEAIKAETDGLREELEIVQTLGADLIFACGETEKPEVKKTIDEMNAAWEGLNRTWRERMERLEEAMTASVQYQDALQGMFDYLDNAVIKLCDMPAVGTDLSTVKQQIEELKQYKVEVYQQQIDMEKLSHQGELLLRKVSDQTDRDMIQEPLTELRHLWDNLVDKITIRQHKLEGALLALGQFQHALSELQSWLSHTHATLDTQRPISSDPKAIEIELAKHHVLRNDVLSHRATVETVNSAGSELLESSPGDEINHLRDQLDELNRSWKNLLLKTDERQKLLEAALQQAEGFHGELEEFLQWLRRTESQLSAAKPTGGLPETAREQLQQHMELQAQLTQRSEQYHRLLDQGESILLARGGEDAGPGTTQTQQNLAMLQNKWASLNAKMDDRNGKLEEAVSLATGFQTSLQDTINWLTQSEQTLNMAQPPSLILDTVLFQIDEHKVFVNEVNTHREQVLALEKAGSQLRFASLKQDVVLIKNLLLSVQARWDKLVQRSLDRGRHLDEARKRAKQFHEAWRKLTDWLEEAESRLDSELEISNEPDKIKIQLAKHKEFQKSLGSKQPVYDTTVRSGKAMRDKATLSADTQKLDNLLGEVRDKWDTVCGKSVERQHKLEEALLFSGQFAEALQAIVDWLYRVEPQLAEDQPVHGDLDLVSNLMDSHKVFQKELGKRTSSVQALKRSARELMETGRDDTAWVKVQVQELSNRWETVCALSVSKQTRLQQALKQAEEFRTAVQMLLEWLSEAEQTLRFRGVLPEEVETLQALLHTHRDFMQTVEEKRVDVNKAASMGEAILAVCHPDCITTIKHWITIIRARFEEVLTWAKQHEQRLETALTELLNNATLLEELLSWLQWAETTLVQRDTEPLPQDITQLKTLISEHQMFMEEMTRKQPDVDKVTKTYKRKPAEHPSSLSDRRGSRKRLYPYHVYCILPIIGNPRLTQLCSRWQQVWLLALDRQRKLNDALDRLEELKEFANFDFDVWRKKYMRWMNHKKSRVMDFFRRIDKDQDGKITRQEFIDGILASKFPTSKLEMTAVADIFDRDCDGYIDYYEFVAALHPNKDAYRPTTDADKIEDEVTRQVAQCKCAKRFQVEQIGENKYRFFLGNQFGDSQQLRLVRILRSTVMVRVGGGWMALDEFLVKNDPCRARGRTNLELREKFILPEGATQGLAAFRSRGRRSKPSSRTASPTRSSSSASHSAHSCASLPSAPATPTASSRVSSTSKLKRPTFHSSRGSLTGENGGTPTAAKPGHTKRTPSSTSGPASRAGSRAGSRASSRRGSDASDTSELMETRSACSDTSDTPRRPGAKPSKIPTISKKAPSPKTPAGKK
uniref:Microtubule actin crosslinking factor 1 n=1 Tax=Cyprinus carpio TaxID=7962 RepID=A0A8C2GUI2_CYPCA